MPRQVIERHDIGGLDLEDFVALFDGVLVLLGFQAWNVNDMLGTNAKLSCDQFDV